MIGFIRGMVGLVLGVLRFSIILENEISASVTAGINIRTSTLGAASAAIRQFRQNNVKDRNCVEINGPSQRKILFNIGVQ